MAGHNGPFVDVICGCGNSATLRQYSVNANIKKHGVFVCRKCAINKAGAAGSYDRSGTRDLSSDAKTLWANDQYASNVAKSVSKSWTDERKNKAAIKMRERWRDADYRAKMIGASQARRMELWWRENRDRLLLSFRSAERRANISKISKLLWMDTNYSNKIITAIKQKWQNGVFRSRMASVRSLMPRISSLQLQLYDYLDDLNIEYEKEGERTCIGYYCFDCLIPLPNGKKLLVECQGDYWHSLMSSQRNDKAKFTYINRYFHEYELMYVWEHEFIAKNRVLDRLKLKLGIDIETKQFKFEDLVIKTPTALEVKSFLDAYHYIGKGRGGIVFGSYLKDELIGCVVYSPPLRQNTAIQFGSKSERIRELARFCIHPSYHKRNFASWFISKTMKFVDADYIIAYSDTTVGHAGTIYKAANFEKHHVVPADYWYVDESGYVVHKRTLYAKARQLKMSEAEYAENYGFSKRYGGEKICFVYDLTN